MAESKSKAASGAPDSAPAKASPEPKMDSQSAPERRTARAAAVRSASATRAQRDLFNPPRSSPALADTKSKGSLPGDGKDEAVGGAPDSPLPAPSRAQGWQAAVASVGNEVGELRAHMDELLKLVRASALVAAMPAPTAAKRGRGSDPLAALTAAVGSDRSVPGHRKVAFPPTDAKGPALGLASASLVRATTPKERDAGEPRIATGGKPEIGAKRGNRASASAAIRWVVSLKSSIRRRLLLLSDSQVVVGALSKGRSSSHNLLCRLRPVSALLLASGIQLYCRWIPSADNPADEPSRRFCQNVF
jgi:hypothetical protein